MYTYNQTKSTLRESFGSPFYCFVKNKFEDDTYVTNGTDSGSSKLAAVDDKITGKKKKYAYENGRLSRIGEFNTSDTELSTETFEYDDIGRLTKDTFTYDVSNSKVFRSEVEYDKNASDPNADGKVKTYSCFLTPTGTITTAKTENTYDDYNRIETKKHTVNRKEFSKAIEYDKTRVKKVTDSVGGTVQYEYDAMGRITSIDSGEEVTYVYDEHGQLTDETNNILDKTFHYEYNDIGNIESVITTPASGTATTTTFTYDGLYILCVFIEKQAPMGLVLFLNYLLSYHVSPTVSSTESGTGN